MDKPRHSLTARRKLLLAPILVLVLYVVVELLALAAHGIYYGELYSFEATAKRRAALLGKIGSTRTARGDPEEYGGVLAPREQHPYVGFLSRPGVPSGNLETRVPFQGICKINDNGFIGDQDFRTRGPGEVHLLMVGGSFAHQAFCMSQPELLARLRTVPRYANKKFKLFTFATGSYKQPQQVMAVNYFLALGGKLDILINLDGYNELTFAASGAHPVYPEKWELFFVDRDRPQQLRLIGRIQVYRELAREAAGLGQRLGFSITAGFVWSLVDDIIKGNIKQVNLRLEKYKDKERPRFDRDGPPLAQEDPEAYAVEMWYRSSRQLQALATAFGFKYYHFIQPNQYVPESKPYSAREQRWIDGADAQQRRRFNLRYATMGAAGERFKKDGVDFTDLRFLFREVKQTLYIDDCCHINKVGNDLVMGSIGDHLVEDLKDDN